MFINKEQLARYLMEQGWKAREALEFARAIAILTEAQSLFEELEDWFNVTECLNHLVYTKKLQVVHAVAEGSEFAQKSLSVAEEKGTKKVFVLRALMSLASVSGEFELALKYAKECLGLIDRFAHRSDIVRHIAYFQLRTGGLEQAKATVKEAESLLERGWCDEKEPNRSIWKVSLLLTQALIDFNTGNLDSAKDFAEEALALAKTQNLKTRVVEAQRVLNLFS